MQPIKTVTMLTEPSTQPRPAPGFNPAFPPDPEFLKQLAAKQAQAARPPLGPEFAPRPLAPTIPSALVPDHLPATGELPIRVVETTYAGKPTFDLWYAIKDYAPDKTIRRIPVRLDGGHSMAPAIRDIIKTCEQVTAERDGLLARLAALDESEQAAVALERNQLRDEVEKLREKVNAYEKRPQRGK